MIWKYCRLPSDEVYPSRGFSIFRELSKKNFDCTIITARHVLSLKDAFSSMRVEVVIIDGVRMVIIDVLGYTKAKSLRRVLGWIQFEIFVLFLPVINLPKPSVIIVSSLSLLSIISGLIMKWRFKTSLIFEVRDIWPLTIIENGGFSSSNIFVVGLKFLEWLGYKYSDKIVSTMPNLAPHVFNILGYERDVTCIPMGIPREFFSNYSKIFPMHLNSIFPKAQFVVTYAGSIGIDNALETLFAAARKLKNDPRFAFFIIGKGDLVSHYKAVCCDLPKVVFSDPVSNKQVLPILQSSTVLYFATHSTIVLDYGQSLNKIIDYMYSGRPVIGSFSGFPSMINEADCGEFVSAGDATALTETLLKWAEFSAEELDLIGSRGHRWLLDNRRYDQIADSYADLILSIK
jgi:glycosyltransferase involved in cell wall biosynthesis